MNRILMLVTATGLLIGAGCKPRPSSSSPAATSVEPAAPSVAVLYFEEIADRAPGGLSVYADQLEDLAGRLREKGLPAHVVLVPADDEAPRISPAFDAAIVFDVPDFRPSEVAMLETFVREGGTLLVIGSPAQAAGLLGVELTTEALSDRDGRSHIVHAGFPFPEEFAELDWGPLATWRWPIRARDARVRIADADDSPVLSERSFGEGTTWHLALLPSGRKFNGWAAAPDAVSVLTAILRAAPTRGRKEEPSPLLVELAANTLAYGEGQWPARVIARVRGGTPGASLAGTFEVRDSEGKVALKGNLQALPSRWRSSFLYADVAKLPPGEYRVSVTVPPAKSVSIAIRRDEAALHAALAKSLHEWLDALDLALPADGTAVSARELEDRALLAWALGRATEIPDAPERYRYDLERLAYWFRAAGPRVLADPLTQPSTLGAIAAGLARTIEPLRRDASLNLARETQHLAEQAYAFLSARAGDDLTTIGVRLWAAAELHRSTRITDYRADADAAARALMGRQIDRGHSVESDVFGDFFADALRTELPPADGGRARSTGFLLGLVALEQAAEPGPFKIDLGVLLDRLFRGLLLGGSALNPYGAFPAGLEAAEPPKPRSDGRGIASPDKFRIRDYARDSNDAQPGVEAARAAYAVVALERYYVTGEPLLLRAAMDQVNHLLGLNPGGRALWRDGRFLNGPIGRGPEGIPVWRPPYSEEGAPLPGNAWLLVLHALLAGRRP